MMILLAVVTHVMPYLDSEGVAKSTATLVATFIPLLSIIGRLGFGWLGDVLDKRYIMAGIFGLLGVGLLAFSYVQLRWLVLPFLFVFSTAYGGASTLRGAILREYFGRGSFGRIFGVMMGIASIGAIIGPSIAGWTFDTLGSYHLIWLAFAGTMGISAILMVTIKPPRPW